MKKLACLLTLVWLLSGCALFETDQEMAKSVDELVSEGSSAFMAGDYKQAVKAYTDLKDWYPFSKYAILAELKIADSHYHLEAYDEAIFAYEEFERMHPKNEAIPYVIYQIGLCWFEQIGTVDTDAAPAQKAMDLFTRLNNQYPGSEYAAKTDKKIAVCLTNLAGHELSVANWYMKTKQYDAALNRYEYLIRTYPDAKASAEARAKIAECRRLAKKKG